MNGIGPVGLTVRPVTAFDNNIYFLNTVTVRKLKSKCCLRQWIFEHCFAYEYQCMTVWVTRFERQEIVKFRILRNSSLLPYK